MLFAIRVFDGVEIFEKIINRLEEDVMKEAFNVVIVVEFVRMLIKHSMNTIVEVLIFAIARGLVVGHEKPVYALISIISIAILLASRKFLFCEHDFEEEE